MHNHHQCITQLLFCFFFFFLVYQGHILCCILGNKKIILYTRSWFCLDLKAYRFCNPVRAISSLLLLLVLLMSLSVIFTEVARTQEAKGVENPAV